MAPVWKGARRRRRYRTSQRESHGVCKQIERAHTHTPCCSILYSIYLSLSTHSDDFLFFYFIHQKHFPNIMYNFLQPLCYSAPIERHQFLFISFVVPLSWTTLDVAVSILWIHVHHATLGGSFLQADRNYKMRCMIWEERQFSSGHGLTGCSPSTVCTELLQKVK